MSRHVVIFSDDPDKGGVANYNHQVALGLRREGWVVSVVQSRSGARTVAEREAEGIAHAWIDYDTGVEFVRTITDTRDAERAFAALAPDVVLFSDCCPVSNIAARHVAIRRKIPFLIVVHFAAPYLAERFAKCLPVLAQQYAAAAEVVAVSSENLAILRQWFGLGSSHGRVIFNGVGTRFFRARDKPAGMAMRRVHHISAHAVVSLTTARLSEVKGHVLQLHALELLRRVQPDSRLVCVWVGDGEIREKLEGEVARLKLGDWVHLVGHSTEVSAWLDAADIFTLTSMIEGMPLCIMEAMARGLPVVGTAISGIPEEMGGTGALLPDPQKDGAACVQALARTWQHWSRSLTLRNEVGERARVRAENLFRAETMLATVVTELTAAIGRSRALVDCRG